MHADGAVRIRPAAEMFHRLPPTPLKDEFLTLADEHSPALAAAIRAVARTSNGFYPEQGGKVETEAARELCSWCPVSGQWIAWAIDHDE